MTEQPARRPMSPQPRHEFDLARERRVRRAAKRQGYRLAKIRTRDELAPAWGRWVLTRGRTVQIGDRKTGASLEDIEDYLGIKRTQDEQQDEQASELGWIST
jgi:hypothetical protein